MVVLPRVEVQERRRPSERSALVRQGFSDRLEQLAWAPTRPGAGGVQESVDAVSFDFGAKTRSGSEIHLCLPPRDVAHSRRRLDVANAARTAARLSRTVGRSCGISHLARVGEHAASWRHPTGGLHENYASCDH